MVEIIGLVDAHNVSVRYEYVCNSGGNGLMVHIFCMGKEKGCGRI